MLHAAVERRPGRWRNYVTHANVPYAHGLSPCKTASCQIRRWKSAAEIGAEKRFCWSDLVRLNSGKGVSFPFGGKLEKTQNNARWKRLQESHGIERLSSQPTRRCRWTTGASILIVSASDKCFSAISDESLIEAVPPVLFFLRLFSSFD